MTSRKPSLLLSLPRRRFDAEAEPGMGMLCEPPRGEWMATLLVCVVDVVGDVDAVCWDAVRAVDDAAAAAAATADVE